ncbi:MAG: class I adenylate cyclase [Proteobacteria bacterium]|nr:class I adenylate cyclase [Pseudomonadota bacterium]
MDKSKQNNEKLTPEIVLNHISKKRKVFINYNIKRLHELIRNLTSEKRKLFHTIPFLLHVNSPDFPGYVDHPSCPYGIFGFHDSGFWKLSLKHGKFDEKKLHPYLSKKFHIQGLYLMGSSGTLAQSQKSDFDYWVLIDQSTCTDTQIAYLSLKLDQIKDWSKKKYNHEVNFFILDVNEIKENRYKAVDEESSGTAQRTILKEEFYRTFILMAGLIPYWAVTPAGIDDSSYNNIISLSLTNDSDGVIRESYIDLGNLTAIRKSECPGAILWQLYKSNFDPAKSLIKASLIAYFNFLPGDELLPCDLIKKKFAESIFGGSLYDPYAIIFDKVTSFLDGYDYDEFSEVIRECVFLRLIEYLSSSDKDIKNTKQKLINNYTGKWFWDEDKIGRFQSYDEWTEIEKTAYDEYVVSKISILYEKVLKNLGTSRKKTDMRPSDFKNLRNRIAKYFRKAKGKVPRCSSYLKAKSQNLSLIVSPEISAEGKPEWAILNASVSMKKTSNTLLYKTDKLFKALAWIIGNDLYHGTPDTIMLQQTHHTISARYMKRLFTRIVELMPGMDPENIDFLKPPDPFRMVIIIDVESYYDLNSFHSAECILQNTWGEFYFNTIDISHIDPMDKKCNKIAEFIWDYKKNATPGQFIYEITLLRIQGANEVTQKIEDCLKKFRQADRQQPSTMNTDSVQTNSINRNEAFLLDQ